MKNKITKLLMLLGLATIITNCGGGGGGGGGGSNGGGTTPTPTPSPYITVVSHTPTNNSENNWVKPDITINFSAAINANTLINTQANIATFLDAAGYTVCQKDSTGCTKLETVPATVTLDDLVTDPIKYIPWPKTGTTQTLISGYKVVGSGNSRSIQLLGSNNQVAITISSDQLAAVGMFKQNVILVKDETGKIFKQLDPEVTGSSVKIKLDEFLSFSQNNTVVIRKFIRDNTDRPLANDVSFSFKTQAQPETKVTSFSPQGIDANALKNITIATNFVIDANTVYGNVRLRKVITRPSVDAGGNQVPGVYGPDLSFTHSLINDNQTLVINPDQDLEYLSEYVVNIKGESGLSGTIGGVFVYLSQNYESIFTTAEPKLIDYSPKLADVNDKSVDPNSDIKVELNFRPEQALIQDNISIVDVATGESLAYVATLNNPNDGTITLKGSHNAHTKLNYNTKYKVTIKTGLIAEPSQINFANVHLAQDASFEFSTVPRKVLAAIPAKDAEGIEESVNFNIEFNFDVNQSTMRDGIIVQKSNSSGGPWTNVEASYSYANRKVTIDPINNFLFNEYIKVTVNGNLKDVAGKSIDLPEVWTNKVKNQLMYVSSFAPSRNATGVSVTQVANAEFTYPILGTTVLSDAIVVRESRDSDDENRDCGYSTRINGRISYDTKNLYFTPDKAYKSFCTHEVTISTAIKGTRNEMQQGSAVTWKFKTDGLKIVAVRVTGTKLDAWRNTDIEIEFNKNIRTTTFDESRLLLRNITKAWDVGGSTYVSGRRVTFDPTASLRYGNVYRLNIDKDENYWGDVIEGVDGERLDSDYYFEFEVENLDIDVIAYGPGGTSVPVGSDFYVKLDENIEQIVSEDSYPKVTVDLKKSYGSTVSGYTELWDDEITFDPNYSLDTSSDYTINFEFEHRDGDIDEFDWSFSTSSTVNATGSTSSKTSSSVCDIKQDGASQRKYTPECKSSLNVASVTCKVGQECGSLQTTTKSSEKAYILVSKKDKIRSLEKSDIMASTDTKGEEKTQNASAQVGKSASTLKSGKASIDIDQLRKGEERN